MCDLKTHKDTFTPAIREKLDVIKSKAKECEIIALKIKSMTFENFQSFDFVYNNFQQGEVYAINGVGYSVITKKSINEVCFVVIMRVNSIWQKHFQDVEKHIVIKQGVYMDLFTGKEYKKELTVKPFEPSYFKAVGDEDLVLHGRVFK